MATSTFITVDWQGAAQADCLRCCCAWEVGSLCPAECVYARVHCRCILCLHAGAAHSPQATCFACAGARMRLCTCPQVWASYSPVKNSPEDARAKQQQGNPTHSATTGKRCALFLVCVEPLQATQGCCRRASLMCGSCRGAPGAHPFCVWASPGAKPRHGIGEWVCPAVWNTCPACCGEGRHWPPVWAEPPPTPQPHMRTFLHAHAPGAHCGLPPRQIHARRPVSPLRTTPDSPPP